MESWALALAVSDPLPLWTWMANGYEGKARLLDQVIAHYRPAQAKPGPAMSGGRLREAGEFE